MKRIIVLLFIMLLIIAPSALGYSNGFLYMLDNTSVPAKNINQIQINEDIYNKYNLFVYGSPEEIKSGQRWKNVSNGCWTKNNVRGEYWVLGQDIAGREVHNPYFPYDYDSGMDPKNWPYVVISGGEESWNDIEKYQTAKQKEYMLTQNLSRNNTTYDFTAPEIGLNKTRVENVATWQTYGVIEVRKRDLNGVYWSATFYIKPMAADASFFANLDAPEGTIYEISEDEDSVLIKINFGASVQNLTGYASVDDINNIMAELFVDGSSVEKIKDSQKENIFGSYVLEISKDDLLSQKSKQVKIRCDALLETRFQGDMPLYDSKEIVITVYNEEAEEEIPRETVKVKDVNKQKDRDSIPPRITSINIKRVSSTSSGKETLVDLLTAKKTGTKFICAGQVLKIEITTINNADSVTLEIAGDKSITTFDELTKKFEWLEPKERGIKTRYSSLEKFENAYKMPQKLKLETDFGNGTKIFSLTYVVPYKTMQTLNSWSTLREKNKNAFEIKDSELFSRISAPYELVFKAKSSEGTTTSRQKLDVFEAWNTIYNRDLSKYVE